MQSREMRVTIKLITGPINRATLKLSNFQHTVKQDLTTLLLYGLLIHQLTNNLKLPIYYWYYFGTHNFPIQIFTVFNIGMELGQHDV